MTCRKVMTTPKCVFRTLWKCRLTHTDFEGDIGLSSDQKPKKSEARRSVEPLSRNDDAYPRRKRTSCRGFLKSKKGGKLSIHYNGEWSNAELLFRTIISVNQLSVKWAIADFCRELSQRISDHAFSSTRKPVAQMNEQFDCELELYP